MVRLQRLLIPALAAVIVLLIAAIRAQILNYPVAAEPRFGWVLGFIAVIWATTYAAGVNETGVAFGGRFVRSAGAICGAVVLIVLLEVVAEVEHFVFYSGPFKYPLPLFVLGLSAAMLIPGLAALAALAQRSMTLEGEQERVIALVGTEERERLVRDIAVRPERQSLLVLAAAPTEMVATEDGSTTLENLVDQRKITLVVLNREAQSLDDIVAQAAGVHSHGVRIRTLSLFYDEWLGKLPLSELERIALLFDINEIHRPVYARMKRFLDVAFALVGLPFLLVVMPFVAIVDLAGNRGTLFYHQERVGKDGAIFTIHKFRTMRPSDGPTDWTKADDDRLSAVGRTLRRLHIDELPQVWNVLRRDLSIVGPRPEQPRYVAQLSEVIPFYETRHLVRPGITGWAQVKYDYGATELDALEKLQYEFYYLRHQSLGLDLRIIGRTLRSIVGRGGR
jgi:lipopolysaccharide/colanic/teichoic acid biosynthesis glycosyltransferase